MQLQIWGCNSTLTPRVVNVELIAFDITTGETGRWSHTATLAPNASTEIQAMPVPGQPIRTSLGQTPRPIVVQTRLLDSVTGEVLARHSNWPEPWKYLIFPGDVGLEITVEGEQVSLSCTKPIKGLVLDTESAEGEVKWSDQGIDLFPGDVQVVQAVGLAGREIVARYMGDGSA
jgi:beta-mannosidase